jgi:putative chitinase
MGRAQFFDAVRSVMHRGALTRTQVESYTVILDTMAELAVTDLRHRAYVFATAYHEVGPALKPIEEWGKGRGRVYGRPAANGKVYYGRGYVQLTWEENYRVMGDAIGQPLHQQPELALDPHIAARIMVLGMREGMFTGKSLSDYFTRSRTDWINARRIINRLDRAADIARHARKYLGCLETAGATE